MAWADMTLEDIRLEVREELGEDDTEADPLWSNTFINKWINRYARIVCEATECLDGYGTVNSVASTANYSYPDNIFKPHLVKRGNTADIDPITIRDLRSINITTEGTPRKYLHWKGQLYLYAGVPNSVEVIHVWGYKYPDHLAADSTELSDVPREVIEIIIKLVIARCQAKDQEYGVANQYRAQVPYDVSDYLYKTIKRQEQEMPDTVDVMGYGD